MTHSETDWRPKRNETDEERHARQRQAQRDNEKRQRETEEARRSVFTAFGLWQACPHKQCKRAEACRGDTYECACQRWRVCVPENVRAAFFKAIEFCRNGMPWGEAVDAADQEMNDRLAIAARLKAAASPSGTEAQPQPQEKEQEQEQEQPGPRIRWL